MDKTIILKEKCPRCGEPMSKFIWGSDCNHNPGGFEIVCSKRCYMWWDYGMKAWRPKSARARKR